MSAPKGNKFALGLTTSGRPPIYDNPEDLHNRIIKYFDWIKGESHMEPRKFHDKETGETVIKDVEIWDRLPESLSIAGLAIFLGFSSKGTLYEYAKKQEFSDSIKRALLFVEQNYEEMLLSKAATGAIFALKNMGWEDKQKVDATIDNVTKLTPEQRAKRIAELKAKLDA